jgi:hypothetical protein
MLAPRSASSGCAPVPRSDALVFHVCPQATQRAAGVCTPRHLAGVRTKQNGPAGPVRFRTLYQVLRARLAAFVDGHGASRRSNHLHVMLLALEHVRHIPIVGPGPAGYVFATLHIVRLRSAAATDLAPTAAPATAPPTVAISCTRPCPTWWPRMPPMTRLQLLRAHWRCADPAGSVRARPSIAARAFRPLHGHG